MQDSILLWKFVASHYGFMLLLGIISYIIGYRLTRRITYDSLWEEVSICASLGLGVIAYLMFLLGILGVLYPWVVLVTITACVAGSYPVPIEIARRVLSKLSAARLRAKMLFVGACFALGVPILVLPLYPPTAFDATMYFLASAKIYAKSHGLVVTPYLRFPVLTQLNEMLFTLALLLYDDIAAQLIQFLMLTVLAIAIIAFCRRNFSKRAGWWSVAILLANRLVVWSGSVAYLEICLMLFSAMAAYTFWNWLRSRETHWLTLSGVFCGFAASTKYPGLFFPLVFGMVTLYVAVRERKYSYPLLLAAATLAIAAPWYIRNYYHTGNPVFPFFPQIFGYSWWSAEDLQGVLVDLQIRGVGKTLTGLLSVPWHLAFDQDIFVKEAPLSPLYFYALPLLTLFAIKNGRIRRLVGFVLAFTLFWFFSAQILRYILPAVPVISVATAASLDMLLCWIPFTRKWGNHGIVVAIIFVVLAYGGWRYSLGVWQARGPIPVSQEERDNYLSRALPSYPVYKLLNDLRGSNYKLYSVYDENMAYFGDGVYMGSFFGPARYNRIFDKLSDGRALYSELKSLGTDYFLVKQSPPVSLPQDSFFRENFRLVYSLADVSLYELNSE